MSKRLLIHYPILNLGGAEMSLLRLIRRLVDRGWQVELVVTTGGGSLEPRLDPRVKLTALRSRQAGDRFAAARTTAARLKALPDLAAYLFQRVREAAVKATYRFRRYDAAMVGLHGLSAAFCCDWVRARRRLHWIRNDVTRTEAADKVVRTIERHHERIDCYVCVAKSAHEALITRFPQVASKAVTIHNVIDAEDMRRQAEGHANPFAGYGEGLKVLTVCRLSDSAKALFRMARAHRRLLDEGLDFHWFVAGDGPDRAALQALVAELGLGERFILLGRQANPFPWYRHADLVAVLSNYEGLSGAVNEAKVIGKAVIATAFSGAAEQLENDVSGLIVENDEEAIVAGMRRVLTDGAYRARLAKGPLGKAILDDEAKLDALEALMLGART